MNRSLSFARLHQRQQLRGRGQVLIPLPVQPETPATPRQPSSALRAHHQLQHRHPLQEPQPGERAATTTGELLRSHRHRQGTPL